MEERLEILLKTLNISPSQFADEIGIKRSGIYHIVKGRNKPGMEFFTKVLERYPDLNAEWLLMGKGRMMKMEKQISIGEEQSAPREKVAEMPVLEANQQVETKNRGKVGSKRKISESVTDPDIATIVIFYKDGTFKEFSPR